MTKHQGTRLAALGITILITASILSGCTQMTQPESVHDILLKATTLPSITYHISSSIQNRTYTAEAWDKNPYFKIILTVNGQQIFLIFRPDGNYMYNATTNTWTNDPVRAPAPLISSFANSLLENLSTSTVTTGMLDGKPVHIIAHYGGQALDTTWIWDDYGVPLQTQESTNNRTISIVQYANYSFADIPDSTFSIQ